MYDILVLYQCHQHDNSVTVDADFKFPIAGISLSVDTGLWRYYVTALNHLAADLILIGPF